MQSEQLYRRTKIFALRIIQFVQLLPNNKIGFVIGKQLLRSGTSVGANYRAASRARSHADFIAKMGIVEEETDESLYWLELLEESRTVRTEMIRSLMTEANELLAMTVASIKTAKLRKS